MDEHTIGLPRHPSVNVRALRLLLALERERRERVVQACLCRLRTRALHVEVLALRGVIADAWIG